MFNKTFNKTLNKTLKQLSIFSMGLGIAFTLTQTVYAENASEIISFHNKTPDSNELLNAFMKNTKHNKDSVERMAENGSSQQPVRFRGISFKKTSSGSSNYNLQKKPEEAANSQTCMAGSQSVAVSINFQTNSKNINNSDAKLLGNIAQAMNSPQLTNCYFVVEGHTDAKGNDYYNLWLSQERAREVKNQLDNHQVAGRRLVVVGKGESQLFNNKQPLARENRRVVFRVINAVN